MKIDKDFKRQYEKAAQDSNFKTIGDAVGMPDEEDERNIIRMIKKYDKENPGQISLAIAQARADKHDPNKGIIANATREEQGLVDKFSGRRHILELPEGLFNLISKGYPIMFSNKKHFAWFKKHFAFLLVPKQGR